MTELGLRVINRDGAFFDTLTIDLSSAGVGAVRVHTESVKAGFNLRKISDTRVGITLDETVGLEDMTDILNVFSSSLKPSKGSDLTPSGSPASSPSSSSEVLTFTPDSLLKIAKDLGLDSSSLDTLEISTAPKIQPKAPASQTPSVPVNEKSEKAKTQQDQLPDVPDFKRTSEFLTQKVFGAHRSETQMLR